MSHETFLQMEKACDLEDGTHVSTLLHPCAKIVHFTEQQIEDFCKPIEDLADAAGWDYGDEAIAVQIQGCQATSPAEIVEPGAS